MRLATPIFYMIGYSVFQILVIEDNKNLRTLMAAKLKSAGYQVFTAENGQDALEVSSHHYIDLYICDIMMPCMDGYEFIDAVRGIDTKTPILIVSAKESFEDKEKGFRLGTDDYMVKPIDLNELLLRVSALLRRSKIANDQKIVLGHTTLDYNSFSVISPEGTMTLPKKEFLLLFKLLSYPNQIFTRHQLLDEIWGLDSEVDERSVDSHVKKLRKKFEGHSEFRIVTLRGLGYKAEKLS